MSRMKLGVRDHSAGPCVCVSRQKEQDVVRFVEFYDTLEGCVTEVRTGLLQYKITLTWGGRLELTKKDLHTGNPVERAVLSIQLKEDRIIRDHGSLETP